MARGGAQAIEGALHADRRVQQYGLLVETNGPRGRGALGDVGPFAGRGIELGVSYAAEPVSIGLTTSGQRLTDRINAANARTLQSAGDRA